MSVKIYNTLTKKKQELTALDGKTVKMYSCGVTVYDKCHIGHARSLYVFDIMRRYLKYRGYDIKFVRNITDVDDKIINKAKETGRTFEEVVRENIDAYYQDLKNLEVEKADEEPRATENIPEMVNHISALIEKNMAYAKDGNVYFRIRSFKDYGKLSHQSIDQMMEATRIEPDPYKEDPLDFALWKSSKEGEPSWESPWGRGRPGWHIECSCMSMKFLETETLDIHAGGRDLVFPHHENEIAQSEALTGKPFAKMWIHHGLLTINGQKMAKSSNNFITVDEVLEKYSNNVLKLFYLQSHYASPVDFSWEKMAEVKKAYDRIAILFQKLEDVEETNPCQSSQEALEKFKVSMDDDFNTPKALSVVFDLVSETNKQWEKGDQNALSCYKYVLNIMINLFGLKFVQNSAGDGEIDSLLKERQEARMSKDFKRSDEIRDQLKQMGIVVEDGKDGQTWRRL